MEEQDRLRRFLFENSGIRGEWVKLGPSWQHAKRSQQAPAHVLPLLGQALAAAVMVSATVKFRGSVILQAQGHGALKTLVAQSSERREIRGLLRCRRDVPVGTLAEMFGDGTMVLTIESEHAAPYQGIVPLAGRDVGEALETYFNQSEQLRTMIRLHADEDYAAGLLLQQLPDVNGDADAFERIAMLANTVTAGELSALDCEPLLYRLFNQERVRLFDAETVTYRCHCSQAKIEKVLTSMARSELESIVAEQGEIGIDCEFCGHRYRFGRTDLDRLFAARADSGYAEKPH